MEVFCLKKFETLDGQLLILHKRGLTITDYQKAKQYLLTNNYYNIINGYSKYFMDSASTYISGSTFDEITQLYFFDKELKFTLFRSITEIENHLKSVLAYRFSETYHDKPYAYLDTSYYDTSKILNLGWLISKLSKIINDNKRAKTDNSIKHYHKKHKDVPIWVLADYLNFGEMRTLFNNLPAALQNKIAKNMCSFISDNLTITAQFTPETMLSFMKNIQEVRNVCAHNNRLLDFKCKSGLRYYDDLHSKYSILANVEKNDVYNVFIAMQCFLSKTQYAQLHNTIKKRFSVLERQLKSININDIYKSLGFPDDWHKLVEKLPQ